MNHKMSKATSISFFFNSAILNGLLIYIQQFTGQNDKNLRFGDRAGLNKSALLPTPSAALEH